MKNSKDSPNKSSSNTGRKFKIPFFGVCCAPEQEPPTFENRSQLAPISSMSRELPVTGSERASIASQSTKSMLKTVKNGVQTKTTYPLNEVFILGTKYKMVTKITKIRVLKSGSKSNEEGPSNSKKNSQKAEALSKALRNSEDETNYRKDIFSLYERGITADDWDQITPEPIAKHIASRTKADIVIDALAGYGGSTIQFAKMSNFVIGIDIDPLKTLAAKQNAEIYDVGHKIDFITADFFKMKNLSGEIVFLNPSTVGYNSSSRPFSIKDNLKPDLGSLLGKSLQICPCVCMKLPKEVALEDLVTFFHLTLESQELFSKRFCIEIEKIYNLDEELECLLIYFGDCSSIRIEQEQQAIYDYVSVDESPEWKAKYTQYCVSKILEKVGIRKSFCFISEIEQKIASNPKMNPSIFDNLLEKLISESYFTQDAINKILDAELHRRSPKKSATYAGSPPSLAKSSSLTAAIRPTTGNSFEEGKKIISTFDPDDQTSPEKEGGKNSLSPVQSLHQSGSRNTKTPFKKNSLDIGELSISEYSVGSNFLKDGYDDQEESSLRKSDYTNNTYMNDSIVPRQSRIVSVGVRDREIGKELEFSKNLNDNNSLLDQVTNPRYLYKSELGPEIGELSPNTSNERIKLEFD